MLIGNVALKNRTILAPMAGVTDLPFRLLCKEQGAALVCMEMVSAKAITFHNKNTEELMQISPEEGPVSLQLFGSEPSVIGEAADMIKDRPFDILDINMGCPVPKVAGNGEGSALMKDPRRVRQIVEAAVEAMKPVGKPVTVKIRKGFDEDHVNAVEIASIAQEAGASAVAVHGRTREQYYSGTADWSIIRQVKEALTIPVIGNGDINSPEKAKQMLEETGCDGLMIGRGVRGNPWLFHRILTYLANGEDPGKPEKREILEMVLRHAQMETEYKGEHVAMREMRKHVAWYTAGLPGSARLRAEANATETLEQLFALFDRIM